MYRESDVLLINLRRSHGLWWLLHGRQMTFRTESIDSLKLRLVLDPFYRWESEQEV
jgi:hypothetical protein